MQPSLTRDGSIGTLRPCREANCVAGSLMRIDIFIVWLVRNICLVNQTLPTVHATINNLCSSQHQAAPTSQIPISIPLRVVMSWQPVRLEDKANLEECFITIFRAVTDWHLALDETCLRLCCKLLPRGAQSGCR